MNARVLARDVAALIIATGLGLGGTVAVHAAPATGPSASATPNPTQQAALATLKAKCNDGVQRRLGTLSADGQFVAAAASVTSADRSALQGQISTDRTGLTALDATIQADTTLAQAHTDCELIVSNFRVYVLEDPKIHEVIAADTVAAANTEFAKLVPQLQAVITASSSPNKAAAQAALNDLQGKVTASQTSISGVSASVINQVPSGYPGNAVTLSSAQQNIKTAKGDLDGARADVSTILKDLK